jgi:endonuclease III
MQKLLEQNTVAELLSLKSENKDLKNKVERLTTGLVNYKKLLNVEEKNIKEAIKKFTYSVERLTNVIDKKKKIEDKELKDIYNFLISQMEQLKKYINKEEENGSKGSN